VRRIRLSVPKPRIGTAVVSGIIVVLAALLIYPMVLLVILTFNTAADVVAGHATWGLSNWVAAWHLPGLLTSLWNSVLIWFLVTIIGLPVGVIISLVLARTNVPHSRGLEVGFWVAYIFPLLSAALGWEMLLSPSWGFLNKAAEVLPWIHDPGPFNIYTIPGLVFTKLMVGGIAFNVILLTPAFRNMNTALEQASRVSGASHISTAVRVTVPVMSAPIALAFALQVINIFSGFEVEYLIGSQFRFYVFSSYIYKLVRLSNPPQYQMAIVLACITMVVIGIVIPFQRWVLGRRMYTTVSDTFTPGLINLGKWRWPSYAGVLLLLFLLTGLPTITLVIGSFMERVGFFDTRPLWTTLHWVTVLTDPAFSSALKTTLILAVTAALIGPVLFSFLAYIMVRTTWRGRAVLDALVWSAAAMPGILIGLGLLLMFLRTPGLQWMFGTLWPLIIVLTLHGATTGTNMFKGVLVQLGSVMEEAGRVSGAGWLRTYVRIVLPILLPSMVLVGMINFVTAASATSSVILLASYNTTSLSVLGLQYAVNGQLEEGGIVSLIIMAMSLAIALPARYIGNRIGLKHEMRAGSADSGPVTGKATESASDQAGRPLVPTR
jgi:iron(III) transport system permease protein